jgi:hypothetical protein
MRHVGVLLLVAVAWAPAGASGTSARVARAYGLVLPLPAGWHVVASSLTDCSNPRQRLAIAGDGALVVLAERVGGGRAQGPSRPRRFRATGRPSPIECCAVAGRAGWMFAFVDRGRELYAYVYPGRPGSSATALRALDGLVTA